MEPADEFMANPSDGRSKAPRLFIKEMIMRNFKSYAGEKHVGPFHKSFSAVVGPNGSGKSNVIDAMLFVFGKRAKQMRLSKVSELIHNSTNHQNLDSASVSVHFQEIIDLDDGTYEAVTGSDFVVTRFAFRDNSSKYCINDRASNFTEVTKKLKGKGVDLDNNRFLILQGEVEQISLMKPKAQGPYDEGFLEYLEDIIGTNKYVEKIDESYEELESLNERRSGVMQLVKLAEKERDRLENSKNEAETYMLKELSVLKWQEKATKLAYKDASAYIVVLQENVSSMEENLKRKREKIQESNYNLKRLQASYKNYMKRQEELDNGLRVCGDNVKEFERQDLEYQADLKHMDQKIERLEKKVDKDVLKINNISKECDESTNLILKLDKDIPQLRSLLSNEEKVIEEIKEKSKVETERYRSELAKVRDELEPWEKQLIEHKGKLEVASTESKLLNEKREAARVAFEDAQKKMDGIMRRTKTTSTSIQIIESNLKEKKCQALEAHKIEQECLKEREALVPLEHAARQKVAELLSGMESEKIQGSVLKGILQAKESNQIEGIYGRMGDLGAIDEKYEVAISTACPGLDYIVVETTGAAQACVELLRKENLGVATFMILEKQVGHLHRLKEKVSTPEGVPRLFDLVKVQDERMKLAFFAAMENTVVAAGIDQASRIAYGRNKEFRRVVTLDGTLFEKSGTISGGGSKPQGGKMGTSMRSTSVSAEAFATAEKELATIVDKLNYICHRVSDAVSHYHASEKEVAHLEMELAKRQKEIKSLESEDSYFRKQLTSLKAESQLRKDELQRLEELKNIISTEEEEIDRLLKGFNQLKKKAKVLQSKIENASGEKLKMQKAKVTKIQSDIDKYNSEINRQKVQREMCKKTLKKLTKGVEELKKEKKQIAEDQKKLTSAFKKQEKIALRDRENIKTQLEAIDQHRHALDNAKSEYDKLKKTVDELRASEVSDDYKLQDMKKSYMEMEMKGKGYAMKLLDLQISIKKHLEQIQKDEVDPRKLHTTLTSETLSKGCDLKWALEKIALLETQVKKMNPNLNSIAEYRRKVVLYNERVEDLNVVTQQRDDVKKRYDEWRRKRLDEFMDGFETISLKLKEMYQMITIEGDAELEIVDPLDPFSSGVVFSVRPPKKSWKNIANLSGGEKTLSSLALVFALHHYKPTPIYVMDEIDATLDFRNVSIVGHYVKDYNQDTQFIIVSLRNNMFELADRLVGTYKTDNCTNTVTINPGNFVVCKNAA